MTATAFSLSLLHSFPLPLFPLSHLLKSLADLVEAADLKIYFCPLTRHLAIMTSLEVGDPEFSKNVLSQIKADLQELANDRNNAKRSLDLHTAEIESEGLSGNRKRLLKYFMRRNNVICTRADLAVSIIGLSIEELTETSRDPLRTIAFNDLLESSGDEDEASIKDLKGFLGETEQLDASSLSDVFEDLKNAFESLSETTLPRTSKILQAAHLAVTHFATDSDRAIRSRPPAESRANHQTQDVADQQAQDLANQQAQDLANQQTHDPPESHDHEDEIDILLAQMGCYVASKSTSQSERSDSVPID
jgi:hypothetical protein